ncbi:hypothetical protein [Kitasatospora sp. NPDC092286]|uniref:hypothetical protein n=1 Tax=Kitasatospora sp. NPDC092286 TaxID=3364087 RepID=UPI00381E4299
MRPFPYFGLHRVGPHPEHHDSVVHLTDFTDLPRAAYEPYDSWWAKCGRGLHATGAPPEQLAGQGPRGPWRWCTRCTSDDPTALHAKMHRTADLTPPALPELSELFRPSARRAALSLIARPHRRTEENPTP